MCFFINVSFSAVVSAFRAFLSSRHSSALYYFYCIVSVSMNKIFIHSYLVRVSRVAEEVTQPCFDRLLLLLLLVLSRCCWCYTLSRICNNSISRARRWAAASAAAAAAATSRSTLELSAVTIDNISWQLSRIAHAACFSPAVALSYMWQARGKQFNIGPANPFPSPSLPSPSPPLSRQFFKNNFPLQ